MRFIQTAVTLFCEVRAFEFSPNCVLRLSQAGPYSRLAEPVAPLQRNNLKCGRSGDRATCRLSPSRSNFGRVQPKSKILSQYRRPSQLVLAHPGTGLGARDEIYFLPSGQFVINFAFCNFAFLCRLSVGEDYFAGYNTPINGDGVPLNRRQADDSCCARCGGAS